MLHKKIWKSSRVLVTVVLLVMVLSISVKAEIAQRPSGSWGELAPKDQLGKSVLYDKNLSLNNNMQCVGCHINKTGWTGQDEYVNKTGGSYLGSVSTRSGNRKPPSLAYATFSPVFHYDSQGQQFVGGNFWDGRATGTTLGSPTAEQAGGPFVNPLEMGLSDAACVVYRVLNPQNPQHYTVPYQEVWGQEASEINWPANIESLCSQEGAALELNDLQRQQAGVVIPLSAEDKARAQQAYGNIGLSVASYEGSREINRFTSKYDYYLRGKVDLTGDEKQGLDLFQNPQKGNCNACHLTTTPKGARGPLFTDFTYTNLGVPRNPENRFYTNAPLYNPDGYNYVDPGLGAIVDNPEEYNLPPDYKQYAQAQYGRMKTPTVRNVNHRPNPNFVKAYMHNGYFKSLKSVVHFYNTRDTLVKCPNTFTKEADAIAQNCWPVAEVSDNIDTAETGNLGLTDGEENQIVAFLKILSDGYELSKNK